MKKILLTILIIFAIVAAYADYKLTISNSVMMSQPANSGSYVIATSTPQPVPENVIEKVTPCPTACKG